MNTLTDKEKCDRIATLAKIPKGPFQFSDLLRVAYNHNILLDPGPFGFYAGSLLNEDYPTEINEFADWLIERLEKKLNPPKPKLVKPTQHVYKAHYYDGTNIFETLKVIRDIYPTVFKFQLHTKSGEDGYTIEVIKFDKTIATLAPGKYIVMNTALGVEVLDISRFHDKYTIV